MTIRIQVVLLLLLLQPLLVYPFAANDAEGAIWACDAICGNDVLLQRFVIVVNVNVVVVVAFPCGCCLPLRIGIGILIISSMMMGT